RDTPGPRGPFPVGEIPAAAFHRLVREMQGLQAAIEAPEETPVDADAANLVFLRRTRTERRERHTRRVEFLRDFLDAVGITETGGAPRVVHPGTLLVLEFDGRLDEGAVYTIAELPEEETGTEGETETISPSSPLGQALMWQPTGGEVSYEPLPGGTRTVVVREIRA
ncbi:GreA/GreB family elongation factor, partial [Streptomyces calidiresistens]